MSRIVPDKEGLWECQIAIRKGKKEKWIKKTLNVIKFQHQLFVRETGARVEEYHYWCGPVKNTETITWETDFSKVPENSVVLITVLHNENIIICCCESDKIYELSPEQGYHLQSWSLLPNGYVRKQ